MLKDVVAVLLVVGGVVLAGAQSDEGLQARPAEADISGPALVASGAIDGALDPLPLDSAVRFFRVRNATNGDASRLTARRRPQRRVSCRTATVQAARKAD
jgi:hypothetical protein